MEESGQTVRQTGSLDCLPSECRLSPFFLVALSADQMALFMQLLFAYKPLSTIYFQLHKPFSKITLSQTLSLTWKVTTSSVLVNEMKSLKI